MNHRELLYYCVEILDSYTNTFLSPEDHLSDYLETRGLKDVDATFVSEVFSGVLRYQNVALVVTKPFYNTQGKGVPFSHESLLKVLTYLALFRIDEIGMAHFRRFVRTQDFNIMYKFLNFFTNDANLRSWMKDEWCKLYDVTFVQTTLLSPITRWLPELRELVEELKKKVDARQGSSKKELPLTKVQEFNLTRPRPRSVPLPQPIPKLKKHKPVPKTVYEPPKEIGKLQEKRVENRRAAEGRLMDSSKKQFTCANPNKSVKTEKKLERIRMDADKKLKFDSYKAKPLPKEVMQSDVPIRLNAATIMREGKLFKEREQEIIKKLESLESGAHDPTKFLKWQNEMRQKDLEAELAAVERRRLEGMMSHEDAILARQKLIGDNQKKVEEMKQETKELMQRYLEDRLEEEQLMRSLVEMVLGGRENAKEAKKKLVQYKAKIVQEVNEESKELMRQALEEAEEEMKRKVELIHQIRAMEAAPISRNKLVDFTETAGYRFLNEMSIAELRERLSLLKEQQAEQEESKRTEILENKQAKDRMLMNTLTVISKHRAEETRTRAEQRANSKVRKESTKETLLRNDEKLTALQEKLEQKKAERLELQQKTKTKPSQSSIQHTKALMKEKTKLEERRWSELEKTKKRVSTLASEGVMPPAATSRLAATNGSRLAVQSRPFIMT
ncbi:cilia- and flagella-associated protein 99-like [Watersipora subatra]|uniref:cilia- and flagella-associated protein 99-like n=1 Tax=Watersipora subatra TaxID=2589382 RepID=UPI00355C1D66